MCEFISNSNWMAGLQEKYVCDNWIQKCTLHGTRLLFKRLIGDYLVCYPSTFFKSKATTQLLKFSEREMLDYFKN